jgi:hypothetical protein
VSGNDADRPAEARPTPYGLVFAHELFEAQLFPAIRAEIEDRAAASHAFEIFVGLEEVRTLLERMVPASEAGGAESAAVLAQHARLLYQAYHYWADGGATFRLTERGLRALLTAPRVAIPVELRPPRGSGYAQLPPNVVWARVDESSPPEPVDGFFWTLGFDAAAGKKRIELAFALGVRSGRPGFSQIEAGAPVDEHGFASWEEGPARPTGVDFENILPGGELTDLHAITTPAEAVKLAGRVFLHVVERAGQLQEIDGVLLVPEACG